MTDKKHPSRILYYEALGFAAIITLSWLDELIGVPHLLFGTPHRMDWREAVLESTLVLLVAIPTLLGTRKILRRMHYLEGFLHICAWCRRIEEDGKWVPIEEYFTRKFDTKTSHGMCPDCMQKVVGEVPELQVPNRNLNK